MLDVVDEVLDAMNDVLDVELEDKVVREIELVVEFEVTAEEELWLDELVELNVVSTVVEILVALVDAVVV